MDEKREGGGREEKTRQRFKNEATGMRNNAKEGRKERRRVSPNTVAFLWFCQRGSLNQHSVFSADPCPPCHTQPPFCLYFFSSPHSKHILSPAHAAQTPIVQPLTESWPVHSCNLVFSGHTVKRSISLIRQKYL